MSIRRSNIYESARYIDLDILPSEFTREPVEEPGVPGHPVYAYVESRRRVCSGWRMGRGEGDREDEDRGNGPLPGARSPTSPRYNGVSKR